MRTFAACYADDSYAQKPVFANWSERPKTVIRQRPRLPRSGTLK